MKNFRVREPIDHEAYPYLTSGPSLCSVLALAFAVTFAVCFPCACIALSGMNHVAVAYGRIEPFRANPESTGKDSTTRGGAYETTTYVEPAAAASTINALALESDSYTELV